ncbi:hypothetical protein CPI40_00165 [Moraxella catarrhalis]|uniref:Uncharacterized protein n=1 Tax=Moraxella nonliquefaciens TaxID=478 RepID=A0A1B8PK50_MORNO|nr:hypothetical protein E9K_08894 [Moraxella catarrhalis 103P14B1]EGE22133.1 hypothetical protein E9W_09812 [Moraxella catarrhalis CO72]MPW49379.1 hypothetical protein [Moraxella catarrhalis]OBX48091.1 hypothetical protein A9Z65_03810 [Moraxella nonliquefaciens]MPW51084.1 hypothetical protein [Moraxella catarrhalis]
MTHITLKLNTILNIPQETKKFIKNQDKRKNILLGIIIVFVISVIFFRNLIRYENFFKNGVLR